MLGFASEELGKGAIDGEGGDTLADIETRDACPPCVHNARDFVAENERDFRCERIIAPQHRQIGRAHACCLYADTKLTRTRLHERFFDNLKGFRSALLCQHHSSIYRLHAWPLVSLACSRR
jgi:hypothetical protein